MKLTGTFHKAYRELVLKFTKTSCRKVYGTFIDINFFFNIYIDRTFVELSIDIYSSAEEKKESEVSSFVEDNIIFKFSTN